MSIRICWLPAVLLVICLHLVNGQNFNDETGTIGSILRRTNEGKLGERFNNRSLFEDEILDGQDIMLTRDQYNSLHGNVQGRKQAPETKPWTDGIIPYDIVEQDFTQTQIDWIKKSMKNWEEVTCLKFRPATSNDYNKVKIQKGEDCWAHLGMIGGEQIISLHPDCFWKGLIEHELGHTIGLVHEHQRANRDHYIRVNDDNVPLEYEANLAKYVKHAADFMALPYDYHSIMHYSKTAFGTSKYAQTIHTRDPAYNDIIGNSLGPSFIDAKRVNMWYGCSAHCGSGWCHNDCFMNKDCWCFCKWDMPKEPCDDEQTACAEWASDGECDVNPGFMQGRCRRSCGSCSLESPKPPCKDLNSQCQTWANDDECRINPNYMFTRCRPACGDCSQNSGYCEDEDSRCYNLKQQGECTSNPGFMLRKCARSCDFCP